MAGSKPDDTNFKKQTNTLSSHPNEKIDLNKHSETSSEGDFDDIFKSNRLLGYTDAIMATSATFLVVPIKNLKSTDAKTFSDYLLEMRTEFIMFFLGFTIVLTIWENMNVRSIFVKRVDDFILTLVILEMLATIILPFAIYLQGSCPNDYVPIVLTCCGLGFIQILDMSILFYAIENPKLLHLQMQKWSKKELRKFRDIVLVRPALCLILVVLGGLFFLVHYAISWVFIAILTIMPILRSLFLYIRRRKETPNSIKKYQFYFYFSKKNIQKERIEVMSDAAFAIIVSLLILDITTHFSQEVQKTGFNLNHELKISLQEFYTFLATFGIVSTLWYVNHCVLHLFRTVPVIALYIQKFFLAFCCLCPLAANMILQFGIKGDHKSSSSIHYASLIVFCASMGNFFLFLYGFLTKDKYFYQWATFGRTFQTMSQQNKYIIFKVLNVPFWSLLCALCSLSPQNIALYILCGCFLATPTSFFVAKLVFMHRVAKSSNKSSSKQGTKQFSEAFEKGNEDELKNNDSFKLQNAHENEISLDDENFDP
ncbi:endosomal/lysosomal proton channel TMEM175 [Hydra vulgaris]|uniref:Endosomal/lysosomal proton channel TMEM175 n=1 Tax=Hydra vulgaris TaxID=6087 RepID=A0ABM4DAP0_HYDVU